MEPPPVFSTTCEFKGTLPNAPVQTSCQQDCQAPVQQPTTLTVHTASSSLWTRRYSCAVSVGPPRLKWDPRAVSNVRVRWQGLQCGTGALVYRRGTTDRVHAALLIKGQVTVRAMGAVLSTAGVTTAPM